MGFSPRDFVKGVVKDVITDPDVQASVKNLVGEVVTTYVVPIIPAAVGAAVKEFAKVADVNKDGKVDVDDAAKAVHDTFDNLLPPFLKPFLPHWNT